MVYADENQVVLYDSKDTDYVRQYQDVPKTSAESGVKSKAGSTFQESKQETGVLNSEQR